MLRNFARISRNWGWGGSFIEILAKIRKTKFVLGGEIRGLKEGTGARKKGRAEVAVKASMWGGQSEGKEEEGGVVKAVCRRGGLFYFG